MNTVNSDAFVFFGATGDLAYKKIFPSLQALVRRSCLDTPVIVVARYECSLDQLRDLVRHSLEHSGVVDAAAFARLSSKLQYIHGDYRDAATYDRLKQALKGAARPLHYLAIPPAI